MRLEHWSDNAILEFYEQHLICDHYCPTECDHVKLKDVKIEELKEEILNRMFRRERQDIIDWNS